MPEAAPRTWTYAEYLQLERDTDTRHEWLDGVVVARSGGTPRHSAIKTNAAAWLRASLRSGPCRPYDSDLKLRVLSTGLATYADVAVVCGPLVTDPADPLAVTNPSVVLEVLSPSTQAWDRGGKWDHLCQVPSLRHYVLVFSDRSRVLQYDRQDDGSWRFVETVAGAVELSALGIALPLAELYADTPDP